MLIFIKENDFLQFFLLFSSIEIPLQLLSRECSHDYEIPEIEKETSIIMPLAGIQRDPKFYPEPYKFIPERFSDDNE